MVILTGQHALSRACRYCEDSAGADAGAHRRSALRAHTIHAGPDAADITGQRVFNLQRSEFHLVPGPVFTSFLLADEINRAPAKTQSALLQAMQERTVHDRPGDVSLPTISGLQERRLRLRRRAIDLVGQQEVVNTGPGRDGIRCAVD